MSVFEPFFREMSADPEAFPADLEQRIVQAKSASQSLGLAYPDFDTYMLTPVGYAVRDELARMVGSSHQSFGGMDPRANSYVPLWTEKAADYYYLGRFPRPIDYGEFNPLREVMEGQIGVIQQQAGRIARNCLVNASATVENTNFAIRSLFNFLLEEPEHDQTDNGRIVSNSGKLIARLAMLNDTAEGKPGKPEFNTFAGVPTRLLIDSVGRANDVIGVEHLVLDFEQQRVDLSDEAKQRAKECSPGNGCPSLHRQVEWRGKTMPMLMAFWGGAVEVAQDRIEQAKADPKNLRDIICL